MNYVAQEDQLGCFIAATAMVFDLTYAEAALLVPLQLPYEGGGPNIAGLVGLEAVRMLAEGHGFEMIDQERPFAVRSGLRYIASVPTAVSNYGHALAIDEAGIALDPANEETRKPWSEYEITALLEFRPVPVVSWR